MNDRLPNLKIENSFILSSKSLLKNCNFSKENQKMIEKIEFSVRRNLEKYPF
jgi:hypothetical protein